MVGNLVVEIFNFQFLFVCLFTCLFVPHVLPISQKENGPIMISKTVLKSGLWRRSESGCGIFKLKLLVFSLHSIAQGQMPGGFSSLQLCCKFQGRVLIKQSFYLPFLNFPGWLVVQLLLLFSSHRHVCRTWMVLWKFTVPCLAAWSLWKWILLWKLVQI